MFLHLYRKWQLLKKDVHLVLSHEQQPDFNKLKTILGNPRLVLKYLFI